MKRQPKCVPALARLAELKLEARLHLLGHYSLWLHPLGRLCALPTVASCTYYGRTYNGCTYQARLYTGLLAPPPPQQQVGGGGGGGGGSGAEASSSEAAEIHALMQMHGVAAAQMGSHAEARVLSIHTSCGSALYLRTCFELASHLPGAARPRDAQAAATPTPTPIPNQALRVLEKHRRQLLAGPSLVSTSAEADEVCA